MSSKAFPPCCGDTSPCQVSPALAPPGEPPADGPYFVTMEWPADLTDPLELDLYRFEECALLPEFACEPLPEGLEYAPTELGVDSSASRPLTVALDANVGVVLVGWDETTSERIVVEEGTGVDLAELAQAVDDAYGEVFANRFASGEDPEAIVTDVLAHPTGGFSPAARAFESFVFNPTSGPPVLFQAFVVFPYVDGQRMVARGTDVLAIRSIEIVDGHITMYVYSAYYP